MYVPFNYNYTSKTEELLKSTTKKFYEYLNMTQKILLTKIIYFLPERRGDMYYNCDTEEISEEPYYRPSEKGLKKCKTQCSGFNAAYVKFLNKSVRRLSEHFFSGKIYVKLYPIDVNVSYCSYSKKLKTYECKCKLSYQITVIKYFYEHVINILRSGIINHLDITPLNYFVTVLFFLKFHPSLAAYYIAFVFFIHKLRWTKNDRLATYPDLLFVPPNVEGIVEEKKLRHVICDKLFYKILEGAKFEEFDINIFLDVFHKFD